MPRLVSLIAAAALVAGCTAHAGEASTPPTLATTTTSSSTTTTGTTAPPPTTGTSTPAKAVCRPWSDGRVSPRAQPLTKALATHLLDPRLAGNRVSVSVWVDGLGEVLAQNGDLRLPIASNQKLLTTMGVLDTLPIDATLQTRVVRDPATGDLVLVAGGDPTLTSTGDHSLAALALAVRAAGVTEVPGRLVVDDTRYGDARTALGWTPDQVPRYMGPLSALTVDDNRGRSDAAFLADPALAHAGTFRDLLAAAGVHVAGPVVSEQAARDAEPVAHLDSPPVGDLLTRMLLTSDNEIAEALTREAGVRLTGNGSTPAGTQALEAELLDRCAPIGAGRWTDGSGLSRLDLRSARELRRFVQDARDQPSWPDLVARLPVAGRSGTLLLRFRGTAAEGRVRAKTGTIIGGTSLTGALRTTSGRRAVFSIVVSGDGAAQAMRALDELVVALAAS